MSGLAELAFRLARAGGARRTVVIMVGAGIVTFLVLAALAIPDAIFEPGSYAETTERAGITMLLSFILVPAVILLMTVSRTSAAIRDRRLASLRMLGLSRRRTALLAGLENGSLTLAGALIGAALFVGLAPVIDRAVAAGPGWFLQPFEASPATTALTVALVTLLAAGLAMSSLSRVARSPLSQRSEAARKEPHALRLLALGVAFTCLLVLRAPQDQLRAWNQDLVVGLLLGGLMAGAVGVALVTPLIAAWAARLFVGSGRPAAVLAGRALQVEPGGTGRLVAGIGVAVYLLVIALGVVAGFESTAQYRSNLQALTTGPQLLWMNQTEGELARDPDVERAIEAVPGVHAAIPRYNAAPAGCEETGPDSPEVCFVHPFVGTCAQLGHLMEVSGCRDDSAGAILVENHEGTATGWEVYPPGLETLRTLSLQFTSGRSVTTPSSTAATLPRSTAEPASNGTPAIWLRSLMGTGTPRKGGSAARSSSVRAAERAASACSACARANSGVTCANAPTAAPAVVARSSVASVTSTAETSRRRIAAARSRVESWWSAVMPSILPAGGQTASGGVGPPVSR